MFKLTSIASGLPIYLNPTYLMSLEQAEAHDNEGKSLGVATIAILAGAHYYVTQTPTEILAAIVEHQRKAEERAVKLHKRLTGDEDWGSPTDSEY